MAHYEKTSFLLPPDLARSVREAVDGERYLVESDIVIEALRDWRSDRKFVRRGFNACASLFRKA
jgi:Arc/MetJ-type ribon-helix-helix transcriptional regulator